MAPLFVCIEGCFALGLLNVTQALSSWVGSLGTSPLMLKWVLALFYVLLGIFIVAAILTPPDAVNYATTKPEGGFSTQLNDNRIGNKIELLAARKSKTDGGFTRVQFDLRNGAYLRQTINVSFEWLAADGTVMHGLALVYILRDQPGVAGHRRRVGRGRQATAGANVEIAPLAGGAVSGPGKVPFLPFLLSYLDTYISRR